eukprot:EG_transcript_51490
MGDPPPHQESGTHQKQVVETCRSLNSLLKATLAHGPTPPPTDTRVCDLFPSVAEPAGAVPPAAQGHLALLQAAVDSALYLSHEPPRHGSVAEGYQQFLLGRACDSSAEALAMHQQL